MLNPPSTSSPRVRLKRTGTNDADPAFSATPRRVLFLAIPPVEALDLVGPHEVFATAGGYDLTICSPKRRAQITSSGLKLTGLMHCDSVRGRFDTFIIAGGEGALSDLDPKLRRWIRKMAANSRRVASVCTGAFVLAAAGLLDGKPAVTHWRSGALLQERYPRVHVDHHSLFRQEGKFYTSAGVTAGIDLALSLVEEDHGRNSARSVAQELVLFLRRNGGQRQFSDFLQIREPARDDLRELQSWILDNLGESLRIETLASRAGLSVRHFCRLFESETGLPPGRYVERARVEVARNLLLETRLGLKEIAHRCGFRDDDHLRRVIQRVVGASPSELRNRFGAG